MTRKRAEKLIKEFHGINASSPQMALPDQEGTFFEKVVLMILPTVDGGSSSLFTKKEAV